MTYGCGCLLQQQSLISEFYDHDTFWFGPESDKDWTRGKAREGALSDNDSAGSSFANRQEKVYVLRSWAQGVLGPLVMRKK